MFKVPDKYDLCFTQTSHRMTRLLTLLLFTIFLHTTVMSQVGIGTLTPDTSSILDIYSTDKGLLIPRMSSEQRQAIVSPARGLMVYDTAFDQFFYFKDSTWVESIGPQGPQGVQGPQGLQGPQGPAGSNGPFYLGKDTLDGIVYYIYIGADGQQHGFIVSKTESTAVWQDTATITNANRSWDGVYNMNQITGSPAKDSVLTLGEGWYLPSVDELSLLYHHRYHVNKALFEGGYPELSYAYYWSSTENTLTVAWYVTFVTGNANNNYGLKTNLYHVRGIKSF